MGEVIVVTSGKGGVGKTTTTANIGTSFAMLGQKTVLLDADIGLRNLDVTLGLENRIVYDIIDVVEGHCELKQAVIKDKRFDTLYLLPASQTKDKNDISADQMGLLCRELMLDFDYVIVDCPAGIEQGFKNAIAGADRAVIVVTPDISAVRDADRVIGLLESAGKGEPLLVINRIRPHMIQKGDMMGIEDIVDLLSVKLLGVIPEDEYIVVSSNRGEPAVANPTSIAGQAYNNIARRLMGEKVPLIDLHPQESFIDKIKSFFGIS